MNRTLSAAAVVVRARTGLAFLIRRGQRVRITDFAGGQVGDLFAFAAPPAGDRGLREYLSASHTRSSVGRLFPAVGEAFVTNRRRPVLRLAEDLSPGYHDMLIAACDDERYRLLGATGHASCAQNLHDGLDTLGLATDVVPQPVNVFMRVPVRTDGTLDLLPAATKAGDSVTLVAELDAVLVLSACPQDLTGINGDTPTDLAVEILPATDDLQEAHR